MKLLLPYVDVHINPEDSISPSVFIGKRICLAISQNIQGIRKKYILFYLKIKRGTFLWSIELLT